VRPGDFRLVDILTLVCPEVFETAFDRLVGEGEGLDRLGVDVDLELVLGAANLFTAGDFDLSLGESCLFNFNVAEVVIVICC